MVLHKIDEIDIGIIEMLEEDSSLTHNQIAEKLNRSQPAIGARIKKLDELGILRSQYGVDLTVVEDFKLVKVDMEASNPDAIIQLAKTSQNVINAFKVSGEANVLVLMACTSLKRLDYLVDQFFRQSSEIRNVRMELITEMANEFILPIHFAVEDFKNIRKPIKIPEYIKKR